MTSLRYVYCVSFKSVIYLLLRLYLILCYCSETKQLKIFGWKTRDEHKHRDEHNIIYHNKAKSAELLSFVDMMKKDAKSNKAPPLAASIVDVPKVVLHFDNKLYKEVMFSKFRTISGRRTKLNSAALDVLEQLKKLALDIHETDVEGAATNDESSAQLFGYIPKERCIQLVTDEDALKSKFIFISRFSI